MTATDVRRAIRVLVADDQPLIRHSLVSLVSDAPDLAVVGQADTGREAVRLAGEVVPDVVIMDIRMPDGDGIEATRLIAADPALAGCRVLVLSMFALDEHVDGALRAGASGFLLKDAQPDRVLDAIRRTHEGESLVAPAILTTLVRHYLDRPAPAPAPLRGADRPRDRGARPRRPRALQPGDRRRARHLG